MAEKLKSGAQDDVSQANQCIAIGAGVGGIGTAAALTLGATCPLCFVAAPVLIGVGLFKRFSAKKKLSELKASAPEKLTNS